MAVGGLDCHEWNDLMNDTDIVLIGISECKCCSFFSSDAKLIRDSMWHKEIWNLLSAFGCVVLFRLVDSIHLARPLPLPHGGVGSRSNFTHQWRRSRDMQVDLLPTVLPLSGGHSAIEATQQVNYQGPCVGIWNEPEVNNQNILNCIMHTFFQKFREQNCKENNRMMKVIL